MKVIMRSMVASSAIVWSLAATAQDQSEPAAAAPAAQVEAATDQAPTEPGAAADEGSGEILVTAQRRSESVQRVPISITVLDTGKLEQNGVRSVLDLQRVVPSFSIQKAQQATNTRLAIRGVGSAGNTAIEPSVGAFVDGVYIARPGSLLAGLNDISSVEVLRGPQGTLFGRNASMGAVSFHTTLPRHELETSLSAEYGSFDRVRLAGALNIPVNDAVAVRVAGLFDDTSGFGRNGITGERFGESRLASLRGTILAELTPSLRWVIRGDYQEVDGDGVPVTTVKTDTLTAVGRQNFTTVLNGRVPDLDNTYTYTVRQNTAGDLDDTQWGASSDLTLDIGGFALKWLAAYRDWENRQFEFDSFNTPVQLFGRRARFHSETHSEELQLTSPTDLLDGLLSFVAGAYYFREQYSIDETAHLGPEFCDIVVSRAAPGRLAACRTGPLDPSSRSLFNQTTESLAGYAQATVHATEALHLTGGIRYSHDTKDGSFVSQVFNIGNIARANDNVPNLRFDGGKITYRLNATYDIGPDVLVFATYATGFKSGGFDAGNGATLGGNRVFRPETTTNYELGLRSQFLDRRLTANATLFRTDVDDFQLRSFNGVAFSVRNAGSIRQQGVEFELNARPIDGLSLGIAGTRLDSEYTDFRNAPGLPGRGGVQDLTGQRAPTSPKWQGIVNASYTNSVPGWDGISFSAASNLAFQSASDVGGAGDNNPQGIQSGYALLGGRLSVFSDDERWEAFVAGDNLTGKGYCTLIFTQSLSGVFGLNDPVTGGATQRCVMGEPRTVRVGAKVKF